MTTPAGGPGARGPQARGPVTDVVIVPAAPLLLPEYQGGTPAAAGLAEACVSAVRSALSAASHVVVVHATDRDPRSTKPPVGRRVADHLLAAARPGSDLGVEVEVEVQVEHVAIAWDAAVADCITAGRRLAAGRRLPGADRDHRTGARPTTLLVVGDGSARRTEKAPGHLDPRAAAVDEAIVGAIRACADGALRRLLELDADLCADLLVAGRAGLQVLAAAVEDEPLAVGSLEVSDPFGVLYVVAHLTRTP